MSSARPLAPAKDTGLPPGVQVGPLGRRFAAYVIDSVVPVVASLLISAGARDGGAGVSVPLVVGGLVLGLAWAVVWWQQLAVKAASPGMRLLKLQLVGFYNGRPVGWGRVLLRWLVFTALAVTGVGLLLLLASVLIEPPPPGLARPCGQCRRHRRAAAGSSRHQGRHGRTASPGLSPQPPGAAAAPALRPPVSSATPAASPAVASPAAAIAADPAIGPELAPLAAEPVAPGPASSEPEPERVPASGGDPRRTILDGWVAELDDGRVFPVRGLVLLGRNPQPEEGEADAELVKLPDESRTVSKTHLALGVDDAGLFVVDRGSTNGSTVTPPGEPTAPVGPFHAVSVSEGSVVSIGDHWVRIRRDAR